MNGIIEIQIGGQQRTLRFNNYAKAELGNIYGTDPLEAIQKLTDQLKDNYVRTMADLVYCGLTGAYYAKALDRDFSRADVAEWMADAEDTEIVKVFNSWTESTGIRKIINQPAENPTDSKKKNHSQRKRNPGPKS